MADVALSGDGILKFREAVRDATLPLVPEPARAALPFNGHVTLARAKGRLGVAAQAELAGIPFSAAFSVSSVDLVASRPSPAGHVYATLARAPLGRRPDRALSPCDPSRTP